MLAQESISRVSLSSRRPVATAEEYLKAQVIIHQDVTSCPPTLLEKYRDVHGFVWGIGSLVVRNTLWTKKYFEITHTYPLVAAEAHPSLRPSTLLTFVFVSGEGATQTPGFMAQQFSRVKGQIETAMLEFASIKPMFNLYNVRPGGVDWATHAVIHKYIPGQALYERALLPPLNAVFNRGMIRTEGPGQIRRSLR